tara:strand:- start:54 stop:560 length:507 start_codon:yes stop_codon:yes gene_type:complete
MKLNKENYMHKLFTIIAVLSIISTSAMAQYKILDPKTGKVQGPRGIEYFPVAKDGSVVWDRKAMPNDFGGFGDRENAIRNLQLQGFKIGGDFMRGGSDYSKDTTGAYVPRKDAETNDWQVNVVVPANKQNAANEAYYKKLEAKKLEAKNSTKSKKEKVVEVQLVSGDN